MGYKARYCVYIQDIEETPGFINTPYTYPPPHTVTKANQNEALLWKIAVLGMKSPQ
jgi:hypothetical protein